MASGTASNKLQLSSLSSYDLHTDIREQYERLIIEAQRYKQIYETIDAQRRIKLKKFIQIVINKLHTDTSELLSKRLFEFLNGHEENMDEEAICVMNEAERLICLSILAEVILGQLHGCDLTEIKSQILLPLLSTFIGSVENKEFQTIFLEQLHKTCPYTVPCYPEYELTMTEEQCMRAIGFIDKRDGNQYRLETKSEYVDRMTGMIRVFCKLLVYDGSPFNKNLALAWNWFAHVLNLPVRPDITAILIRVFINEAGTDINRAYPKQFPKLIRTIQNKYFPILENDMSSDQMIRLQLTLDEFLNK